MSIILNVVELGVFSSSVIRATSRFARSVALEMGNGLRVQDAHANQYQTR
jgi:hypothetical protein